MENHLGQLRVPTEIYPGYPSGWQSHSATGHSLQGKHQLTLGPNGEKNGWQVMVWYTYTFWLLCISLRTLWSTCTLYNDLQKILLIQRKAKKFGNHNILLCLCRKILRYVPQGLQTKIWPSCLHSLRSLKSQIFIKPEPMTACPCVQYGRRPHLEVATTWAQAFLLLPAISEPQTRPGGGSFQGSEN